MSAKTIKSALGLLQDDPDHNQAWQQLRDEIAGDPGMSVEELTNLLDAARKAHDARREVEAVARLLDIEVGAVRGTPREADLIAELARVFDEELLDDQRARATYERLLALRPSDSHAVDVMERSDAKRSKWRDLVDRYAQEAQGAGDPAFRSSLLVSAAEVTYRYGREGANGNGKAMRRRRSRRRSTGWWRVSTRRAGATPRIAAPEIKLLESRPAGSVISTRGTISAKRLLENFAERGSQKDEKISGWVRLARVFAKKLKSDERAAAAYERVLDLSPGHPEASSFLADHFTASEKWDHLVALYEGQLPTGALRGKEELGTVVQVAMVHWRMRGKPEAAEPWFERVRKLEPAHPGMLAFFREYCIARGEAVEARCGTDGCAACHCGRARSRRHRYRVSRQSSRRRGANGTEGHRTMAQCLFAAGSSEPGKRGTHLKLPL